jgi:1-deoxy-D-xylulose-5-phosphate synthase
LKKLFWRENILENIGIDYIGVVDGHDLNKLNDAFNIAKNNEKSIIVHVKTIKGYGCEQILNDEDGKWHGVGKFDLNTFDIAEPKVSFDDIVCDYLCDNALKSNLCVITPAMKSGSRLDAFFNKYKERSFDVGISEEHAFVFASGLALKGIVPYISVYSTFMQRSYDFINQDLVRNKSKCVIGVERVGLVGEDGESHHGIFDVALVNHLPNITICMPIYCNDINILLDLCFNYEYLSFIRLPKNKCYISNSDIEISYGKWNYLCKEDNSKIVVLSVGPITIDLVSEIKKRDLRIDVIGVYFIKPLDEEMLKMLVDKYEKIIVYDVYSVKEGVFLPILEFYNANKITCDIEFFGLENKFYKHGKLSELLIYYKLDVFSLLKHISSQD